MAKRATRKSYFPIKIPINTLSGGVGRQAPSKRLLNEAEDMDNMFCTTERSIDKRNGFEILGVYGEDLQIPDLEDRDMWWYWYNAGSEQRYLIGLDFNATSVNDKLLFVYKLNHETGELINQSVDPNIDIDIKQYISWSGETGVSKDALRACAIGSSVLILNTGVKAGFTSDGIDGDNTKFMFGMDGIKNGVEDLTGQKLEYQTSVSVDPEGAAEVWTKYNDYVWGSEVIDTSDEVGETGTGIYNIWRVQANIADTILPGPSDAANIDEPSDNTTLWEDAVRDSAFIPVEDYVYPDASKLYLGQTVARFSDLRFPPDSSDVDAHNGAALVQTTLKNLYPNIGNAAGFGKIYYLSQTYFTSTPGWYRVINHNKAPYLQEIRTRDEMSVIDKKRMPVQIYLDTTEDRWSIRQVDWNPRTSGTVESNPGPSFFTDKDGKARQIELKAISFYRDRLFLSTEDTLISSRLGDFSDLFLGDPSNITFRDPLDLEVSSNVYTPITFLRPFKDFLFLGTSGDTQYELVGSENQISPLTAEIAPTSFFPMTEDVEPMVMNNNLFFFSKKRLFIYFQRFESAGQQAFELSRHVPDYLPERFWDTTVSTSHNMIFAVDGDGPSKEIICYRNQIQGETIIQNAFFRFTLPEKVHSLEAIGDYLYIVVGLKNQVNDDIMQVHRLSLIPDGGDIPRIDSRKHVTFSNRVYDPSTDKTTLTTETCSRNIDHIVFSSGKLDGTPVDVVVNSFESNDTTTALEVEGNYIDGVSGYIGNKFTSLVTLSDTFLRDAEGSVVPGTLNLRYGVIRHRITGNYNVGITRKNRAEKIYKFTHNTVGARDTSLDGALYEEDGIFKFPIMGFSDDMIIKISSDFPSPMNLTNIELTGKFKRVPHFLTT